MYIIHKYDELISTHIMIQMTSGNYDDDVSMCHLCSYECRGTLFRLTYTYRVEKRLAAK